jgi:nickel/cobalt exporter
MSPEIFGLCLAALSIGVVHTLLGPDHYLPFVALARAEGWTARKTLGVTIACGLGHVAGSVAIGSVGLLLGAAVMRLEAMEAYRGDVAAWALIGLGVAIMAAGMKQPAASASRWAPWLMFLVFVLGPCEPLIPLLMIPAATMSAGVVAVVVAVFTAATVGTMAIMVLALRQGLVGVETTPAHRFGHVVAGVAIMACGVLVKVGL